MCAGGDGGGGGSSAAPDDISTVQGALGALGIDIGPNVSQAEANAPSGVDSVDTATGEVSGPGVSSPSAGTTPPTSPLAVATQPDSSVGGPSIPAEAVGSPAAEAEEIATQGAAAPLGGATSRGRGRHSRNSSRLSVAANRIGKSRLAA